MKLEQEIKKLKREADVAYVAPLLTLVSILLVLGTLLVQRNTALNVQRRGEQAAFELKAAELIMSSPSPWAAESRLKLLMSLYPNRLGRQFAEAFRPDLFPGVRKYEMRLALFEAMAGKTHAPSEVPRCFATVFPEEREPWLNAVVARVERDLPRAGHTHGGLS